MEAALHHFIAIISLPIKDLLPACRFGILTKLSLPLQRFYLQALAFQGRPSRTPFSSLFPLSLAAHRAPRLPPQRWQHYPSEPSSNCTMTR